MTDLRIDHARVLQPHGGVAGATVYVEDGRIVSVATRPSPLNGSAADPSSEDVIDAGGRLLTPGLIDLHIHGIETSLFEIGPEALLEGLAALPRYGVTTVLPTLYRVLGPDHLDPLRELAEALALCDTVNAPGFHLEGPFLKLAGAGGLTMAGDVAHLDALLDAANGRVTAMSLSPDTPGIVPVIQRLVQRGVVPFITHTQATYEQTMAAIDAGARHTTHFYDVFPAPEATDGGVRPVGCVEAVLEDPRVSVDFIADGVHVHPGAIRLALRCKRTSGATSGGTSGVCLITDANIGAGMPAGRYPTPWGFAVEVGGERGGARVADPDHPNHGRLAGSALTMPQAVANARRWLDGVEHDVWAMATANPAGVMGWAGKGQLRPGHDADLVLWDEGEDGSLTAAATWVRGRCVYRSASLKQEVPA